MKDFIRGIFIIISVVLIISGGILLYTEGMTVYNIFILFAGWINFNRELTNSRIEELEKQIKELRGK